MFRQNRFKEDLDFYSLALGVLEQLMLREKPKEEEWNDLAKIKVPLLFIN